MRMVSGRMESTSSSAGSAGELKPYDMSVGWIMHSESVRSLRISTERKYAVSSGEELKTCHPIQQRVDVSQPDGRHARVHGAPARAAAPDHGNQPA
eukprot:COSAG01_NODE_5809_length_4020_cov_3.629431_5_plen_96_part_00